MFARRGIPTTSPRWILAQSPGLRRFEHREHTLYDEQILVTMILVLVGYAAISAPLGSHLWGCFVPRRPEVECA